ncbi:MAG TPA: HAD-IA family hydrolase, partial [Mycobacterium sp.]
MPVFSVTALLFDCDGVLVDSLDAAAVAWNEWGTRWKPGFDFHRDVEHGRRLADFVTELVGPENAPEAIAELAALEREHAVDVREIPGAATLLAGLPAGRWAVVTSGTRDIATARLAAAGIPTPAVLVTADDVTIGKPAPDPYLLAAARLDQPPSACAVFED